MTTFPPSFIRKYGQEAATGLSGSIQGQGLSWDYDEVQNRIILLGSSGITSGDIQKIFARGQYGRYRPRILGEKDKLGNYVVRLFCNSEPSSGMFMELHTCRHLSLPREPRRYTREDPYMFREACKTAMRYDRALSRISEAEIREASLLFLSHYPQLTLFVFNEISNEASFCLTFAALIIAGLVTTERAKPLPLFLREDSRIEIERPLGPETFIAISNTIAELRDVYSNCTTENKFSLLIDSIKLQIEGPVIPFGEEKKTDVKLKILEIANVVQTNPLFIVTMQKVVEQVIECCGEK